MLYVFIAGVLALIDQLIKLWSVKNLIGSGAVPLIPGVLQLFYTENTGAAFGILKNHQWLFILISAVTSIFICVLLLSKLIFRARLNFCLAMILGGALGNLIDRFLRGYVVDMFEFTFMRFAVFNFADICLTVGGTIFCIFFAHMEFCASREDLS